MNYVKQVYCKIIPFVTIHLKCTSLETAPKESVIMLQFESSFISISFPKKKSNPLILLPSTFSSRSAMDCFARLTEVKSFHVKVLLLDKQEIIQEILSKTTGQNLLDNIFKHLNLIETAYFGLRFQDNENQTVRKSALVEYRVRLFPTLAIIDARGLIFFYR